MAGDPLAGDPLAGEGSVTKDSFRCSALAAPSASLIAKKTDAPRKKGGSPTALDE